MKKLLLGMLIGFLVATGLAIMILKLVMADKYKFGRNKGLLDGESEVIGFLYQHFPVERPPRIRADGLVLKPGGVYVVEENGKKSIEVTIH